MLHRLTRREMATSTEETGPRLIRVKSGAADWCVRADWRDRILGETAPDWFRPASCTSSTLLKKGRNRTTWRMHLGSDTVFVKLLIAPGFRGRLRQVLGGTPAEREWLACRRAERLGIPVSPGLAVSVSNGAALCNVFLAQYLTGAVPVAGFWRAHVTGHNAADRRHRAVSFIETVAKLIASAHEAGFLHRDGHPNNILLQSLPDGRKCASFVDIYGARFTPRSVSMRRAVHSLAQLDQYFQRMATRTERVRFLRDYLQNRESLRGDSSDRARERQWSRRIVQARLRLASKLARQWDRRLRRNGKYFSTLRLDDGWTATVVLKLERRHVFPEPAVPDRSLHQWRALLNQHLTTTDARDRRTGRTKATGNSSDANGREGPPLCLEHHHLSGLLQRIRARLGSSRHKRLFERQHKLRHRDEHAPLILGFAEHTTGMLVDQTALIHPVRPEDPCR